MDKQYGLLEAKISPRDWMFGASPINNKGNENPLSDWKPFLPVNEKQKFKNPLTGKEVEPMSCVPHSTNNSLEIMHNFIYRKEINLSDRELAKMSQTTRYGNWLYKVADEARDGGLVKESRWTYPTTDAKYTWEDYYSDIPQEVLNDRIQFKKDYTINHEWVTKDKFKEALRYTPLQITCYAWIKGADGLYHSNGKKANHAVVLTGYREGEYWEVFDSYPNSEGNFIKKLDWDNIGDWAKAYYINKNVMDKQIKDNTLVQLVEGHGGFGLYLDGRLIVDELDKIQASFIVRNNGNIDGMTASVTQDWWDNQEKINLKGEEIK